MESATLTKNGLLHECRARVQAAEAVKENQATRVESLTLQKAEGERAVTALEVQRSSVIAGIGKGTSTDSDLAKVKKELFKARDVLQDVSEILVVTTAEAVQAERDLTQAKASLAREEERAWGGVVAELYARHKDVLEKIWHETFVASILSNKGQGLPTFIGVLNGFKIARPTEEQHIEIMTSFQREFDLP